MFTHLLTITLLVYSLPVFSAARSDSPPPPPPPIESEEETSPQHPEKRAETPPPPPPPAEKSADTKKNASTPVQWIKVERQKNADCGYHALYNAVAHYVRLHNKPMPDIATTVLEAWRTIIVDLRDKRGRKSAADKKGEWLNDEEIEYLKDNHLNVITFPTGITLQSVRTHLKVIPNMIAFNPEKQDLTDVIRTLRTRDGAVYAFVLGNMVQEQPTMQGHWIAATVQNNKGVLTYNGLDSIGGNYNSYIIALEKLVESDINVLTLVTNPDLANAETQFAERRNYPEALKLLTAFIELAQTSDAFNSPYFKHTKEEIFHLLTQLAEVKGSNNQAYAHEASILLATLESSGITSETKKIAATVNEAKTQFQSNTNYKKVLDNLGKAIKASEEIHALNKPYFAQVQQQIIDLLTQLKQLTGSANQTYVDRANTLLATMESLGITSTKKPGGTGKIRKTIKKKKRETPK